MLHARYNYRKIRPPLGLTLIELVVTVTIIAVAFILVGSRLGIANYWKEEGFLRKLRETITFLHQQAVVDQTYYHLQLDFKNQKYQVFAMNSDQLVDTETEQAAPQQDIGYLTHELSQILSPAIGSSYNLIAPPSFPSLGEAVTVPGDLKITSLKTARGEFDARDEDSAYILFSPRGFSEFAVIHLNQGDQGKITILVNSFIGSTEIYRDDRDFEWTYGKNSRKKI